MKKHLFPRCSSFERSGEAIPSSCPRSAASLMAGVCVEFFFLLGIIDSFQNEVLSHYCQFQICAHVDFGFVPSRMKYLATSLAAGVELPLNCLIVQNRQAMQSIGRSMDLTLEDNMVDGLFFCATLTGSRGGHIPFVQAGAETSDAGAEAVKPEPGSSWEGHSWGVGAGVGD